MMRKTFLAIVLTINFLSAFAQVKVEGKIDPMEILVGQQAGITLTVTAKEGQQVEWPEFKYTEQITPGVEVVSTSTPDTTRTGDGQQVLTRVYTITSFDDTLYYLPPMKVKVGGKAYPTRKLALKVLTIEVDTLHPNQFYPPKTVQAPPFAWSEWAPLFWLSLLMLVLLVAVVYLYVRLRDNKPIISRIRFIKHLPPHQKAMMEIGRIKAEGFDTEGEQKEYYTRLTDALRTYLEERFGIQAMEMTSGEIIQRLQQEEDLAKIEELRQLLETADLVKFAKHSALLGERDRNMESVITFIQTTKRDDAPVIERVEPQLTDSERRSRRSRTIIIGLITVLSIATLFLIGYVVWQISQLII